MDADISEIVERLRRSRSTRLLRVIDEADLDAPAFAEPEPDAVVAPYRWLLEQVDDGVRLTQAGYLPPAIVSAAMRDLGWLEDWYGKGNREDLTLPVLELRESAQRFGLVRKNRGQLLVTKLGRKLLDDPAELWWHLATRLPDARSEPERHAGVLYLLSVAAGRARDKGLLVEGMTVLGWAQPDSHQPISDIAAFGAARDTWALFHRLGMLPERARWDAPELPPAPTAIRLARAALLGRAAPVEASLPPARRTPEQLVQLTVTLRGIEPAIWRRLVVPGSLTLHELHAVIQTAMGWAGYHLHMFDIGATSYGDIDEIEDREFGNEAAMTVGQVAAMVGEFSYEYDFGDSWDHDVRVEHVTASVGPSIAHLTGAARACPPEDCGGISGYEHLLEVLGDPTHEEHVDLLHWVGGGYDPEHFDLAVTNANLELYDRHTRQPRVRR